jgi:dihydrodipicolinate synthase/N-acetylneuraminate lyase
MSYVATDLHGVCGMMPAFATSNASDWKQRQTFNEEALRKGLDRAINDGVHMIATTGTFGQVWNLFFDEWQALVRASIETVNNRVPLMLGVTSANPRELYLRMKFVQEVGGQGVLLGLPYYEPLPVVDIPHFYRMVAEEFPNISIMIYHNPVNHHVHIPVNTFNELAKIPNIVAMKDSHRTSREFLKLHTIIHNKIAHFVNQTQLFPYHRMGASGCWSHAIWAGPWPILALYDAASNGEDERASAIIEDIAPGGGGDDERVRRGNSIHQYAGYIDYGTPRPPFSFGISDEGTEKAKAAAARWQKLCEKYRPEVEARRGGRVLAGATA